MNRSSVNAILIAMVALMVVTAGAAFAAAKVDINWATRDKLIAVKGIGDKVADAIILNRPFWCKEELKGFIRKTDYTKIESLIICSPWVNINTAGFEELTAIHGVGPKTAEGILAFRSRHGQITNVEQLRDYVPKSVFTKVRDKLLIDPLVNINTASSSELQAIKGIGPGFAGAILDFRLNVGPFRSKMDLRDKRYFSRYQSVVTKVFNKIFCGPPQNWNSYDTKATSPEEYKPQFDDYSTEGDGAPSFNDHNKDPYATVGGGDYDTN